MAIERNIALQDGWFLGEDKQLRDVIYQADGVTPQNITGWAISFMLKKNFADADVDAKITKAVGSGIALTTPASGVLTVTITDDDTVNLAAGTYRYELKRTDPGAETVLTFGSCVLRRGVHAS